MTKTKNYDNLDLAKFILSIMIVTIHSILAIVPSTSWLYILLFPYVTLSVPLFFVISSFLLFKKVANSDKNEQGKIIKKYIIRQLQLYLFWFIVLLPVTIYVRKNWFDDGILIGIYNIIKNLLFSSTFIASWFIASIITATLIVYKLSKKFNYKILFILFIIIYFLSYLFDKYYAYININFIKQIFNLYLFFLPSPIFSFPVALIWVLIGKMFADGNISQQISNLKIKIIYILFYLIYCFIFKEDLSFFWYPLMVIFIFQFILNINITLKNSKILRQVSTITYPLHASVAPIIIKIVELFINNINLIAIISFIATLIICYIACYIILKLEQKETFKILRYSH